MKSKVILLLGLLASSAFSAGVPDAATSAKLLQLHNQDRGEIGLSSLSWSADLASSAQEWANTLAADGTFAHSGTKGVGENLAKASFRDNLIDFLYGLWSGEKKYFDDSKPFPDCSTTGNWQDVAHYTQIMWAKTSQVGCGIADTTGSSVLVCHYKVAGNYKKEYVYTSADIVSDSGDNETEEAEEAETTIPSEPANDDSQDDSSEEAPAANNDNNSQDDSNEENDDPQDDSNEDIPADDNNSSSNDDTSAENSNDGNSESNSNDDNESDSTEAAAPKPTKKAYQYSKGFKKTYTRVFKGN